MSFCPSLTKYSWLLMTLGLVVSPLSGKQKSGRCPSLGSARTHPAYPCPAHKVLRLQAFCPHGRTKARLQLCLQKFAGAQHAQIGQIGHRARGLQGRSQTIEVLPDNLRLCAAAQNTQRAGELFFVPARRR